MPIDLWHSFGYVILCVGLGILGVPAVQPVAAQPENTHPTPDQASHTTGRPGLWAEYDFVAGDSVLFYHDFEDTPPSTFPARLGFVAGTMEVVALGDNKVLRTGGQHGRIGCFTIPIGQPLPERTTIEFRTRTSDPAARMGIHLFSGTQQDLADCRYPAEPYAIMTGYRGAGLVWDGSKADAQTSVDLVVDTWADVRMAKDGDSWKMYVNERRVANVPRLEFPNVEALYVMFGSYRASAFIDDIRVAEGGQRSLYDDLVAEGVIFTTAIRFDTGRAQIKPESTGILNEVLDMLETHDEVNLLIEGHTDDVGSEASTQTLSRQHAEAVAAYLVNRGIDPERLDTAGYGESQPVADNSTLEGQAMNRRVGFRKQ